MYLPFFFSRVKLAEKQLQFKVNNKNNFLNASIILIFLPQDLKFKFQKAKWNEVQNSRTLKKFSIKS